MSAVPSFLSYTPVALAFGTSGLRGLVDDITDLETYINVKGGLRYLLRTGDVTRGGTVVLARRSAPEHRSHHGRAAARAIVDAGFALENAGKIPTPALMLHSLATRRAGVMVTGSHIPFDRNGIKISKSGRRGPEVGRGGHHARRGARPRGGVPPYGRERSRSRRTGCSRIARASPVDPAAEERYVRRYVQGFAQRGLGGCGSSSTSTPPSGATSWGGSCASSGRTSSPRGAPRRSSPSTPRTSPTELLERLERLVARAQKPADGSPDVIVSTDGDSDRPLVPPCHPARAGASAGTRVRSCPGDLLGDRRGRVSGRRRGRGPDQRRTTRS